MNIESALDDFLLALRANRRSLRTIKWYVSLLTDFTEQFEGQELTAITAREIRLYMVALEERNQRYIEAKQKPTQEGKLSPASISGHVRALHAFWRWCHKEYDILNPMRNIPHPKAFEQDEPKAINKRDFVKLFNATGHDLAGIRDRAILVFLADTGCRLGGLIGLEIANVDTAKRQALVREKGNQIRVVVFTHYTAALVQLWLDCRISESTKVFTSMNKKREGLTMEGVHQMLRRLKEKAGVTGRVNPHSMRHRFALDYLSNGGDDITLAKLLGHKSVNTTKQAYSNFKVSELAALHEKRTPLRTMYGMKRSV